MVSSLLRTMTTGYESWYVTSPITCPHVPRWSGVCSTVATKSSATPSRISGRTKDRSTATFAAAGSLPRQRSRPNAIATPSGMVITVASTPSHSVCTTAVCRLGSFHTDCSGSP